MHLAARPRPAAVGYGSIVVTFEGDRGLTELPEPESGAANR